jgi:DNA-binding NarL/FixJ family response regulator
MNILIVDDHAIVRAGLRRLLRGLFEGDVLEAATGREALSIARAQPLDLVLLDMNLPELGGLELLSRLSTVAPALPVLILSMHAEPLYITRAIEAGARGYVSKNIAPDELVTAIRQMPRAAAMSKASFQRPSCLTQRRPSRPWSSHAAGPRNHPAPRART